ncbi:PIN domain-containing protein [Candidatus Uhrbacteria bacterium]|nr:PIN domain-containing protein [Candidatus Uhrbacteria bacterium]
MALKETLCLIDTNVFLAVTDPKDALCERAKQTLDSLKEKQKSLILLTPVIEEMVTFLFYKQRGELAKAFIDSAYQDPSIVVRDVDACTLRQVFALASRHAYRPKISLTDWVLLYHALNWKVGLVTFDKQLYTIWKKLA